MRSIRSTGHGELGLGEAAGGADASLPVPVRTLPLRARQLVRGEDHACAIATEDGREDVFCYGAAEWVGNGTPRNEDASVAIQWQGTSLRWDPDQVPAVLE